MTLTPTARLHLIAEATLAGLFAQHAAAAAAPDPAATFGCAAGAPGAPGPPCARGVAVPALPSFETVARPQQGFSLELALAHHAKAAEHDVLFDTRGQGGGAGIAGARGEPGGSPSRAVPAPPVAPG